MRKVTRELFAVNALYALIPLLLLLLPQIVPTDGMEPYGAAYCAYMVCAEFGIIVLPTLAWFATPWGRETAKRFWGRRPDWSILLMIPLGVCAYFAMNGVSVVWMLALNALGLDEFVQRVPTAETGAQVLIGMGIIAMVPAICEEFFCRGVLQPELHGRMKPWVAILLGGAMFALLHGQVMALPVHVLLGAGLCLVAYWTRSVWYTMVWHLMQNGIAVVTTFVSQFVLDAAGGAAQDEAVAELMGNPIATLTSAGTLISTFGMGAGVCLVLLYLSTRRMRQEPVERSEERPHWVAYVPLLVAAACIVYLYVRDAMWMAGGVG